MSAFSEIIGNENIVNSLKSTVHFPHHAYVFDGGGSGFLAKAFAKALLCKSRNDDDDSCGKCTSCKMFESGNNPDFIFVKPAETKSIGADDIRQQVIIGAATRPYMYKHKVFIIDEAKYGFTVGAQTVFLKTLEEPPDYCVFIIVAKNSKSLMATIVSRAVVYRLKSVNFKEISDFLIKKGLPEHSAILCAVYSGGSVGHALRIANDENFLLMRESIIQMLRNLASQSAAEILLSAKELEKYKENINDVLDIAALWFRDVAVFYSTGNEELIIQTDLTDEIKRAAEQYSGNREINAIIRARRLIDANVNFLLTVETMLLNVWDAQCDTRQFERNFV
ncbi:MAG: hypothetical protein LBM16_05005 [Clostridiales bacterium]|jgi:DNA polymerase-3 subunit delta'|nr:hypothetical protein [Clostridiales bacterium]